MKRKPERQEPNPPGVDDRRTFKRLHLDTMRRAQFLMSPFNLREAHRNKRRIIGFWTAILFLIVIGIILWAVTR